MTHKKGPDDYGPEFARLEAEYERRESERINARIEAICFEHSWNGGYFCHCGFDLNSADTYARHILRIALDP